MRPSSLHGAGRGGLGGEHAARPVERLGAGRSAAWIGADLLRVDAQLRAEAMARAPRPGRRAAAPRRRCCGVTPATGAAGPRRARPARAGSRRAPGRRDWSRDVQVEVERDSRACRRPGASRLRVAATRLDVEHAARAFDQRQHTARRAARHAPRRASPADSALGSISVATAQRWRSRRRSSSNHGRCLVVDAHAPGAHAGRRWRPRRPTARSRRARRPCRRRHRVFQVEHDGIGAAGQRLGEALGAVARHEQVGAWRPPAQMASAARSARMPSASEAQLGQDRVGVLAQRRHRVHARAFVPACPAAASPAAGRPASRPRASDRAPSAAGAPTPRACVLTRALAICAASSRSTTCGAVSGAKASTMISRSAARSATRLALPVKRGSVASAGCSSTFVAEVDPLALVLQAQHHACRRRPVGNGP